MLAFTYYNTEKFSNLKDFLNIFLILQFSYLKFYTLSIISHKTFKVSIYCNLLLL